MYKAKKILSEGNYSILEEKKVDNKLSIQVLKSNKNFLMVVLLIMNKPKGVIYRENYFDGGFSSKNHLYKKLEHQYRGEGHFQKMFDLYQKYGELPSFEYSSRPSSVLFLLKNGYKLYGLITNTGILYKKIIFNEKQKSEELKNIKNSFDGNFENKLFFTYILKREK